MSTRKKLSNKVDKGARITSAYKLANLAKWTTFCAKSLNGDRWRKIAEECGKSKGWWNMASKREWKRIKPTMVQYEKIKRLHDAIKKFGGDKGERLRIVLEILKDISKIEDHIAQLIKIS